jgi:hypothetical protein
MQGCEAAITKYAREVREKFELITYLEIGVAYGQTLTSIASLLAGKPWRAIGVDLPQGYSYDQTAVKQCATDRGVNIVMKSADQSPDWNQVNIYLVGAEAFFNNRHEEINMALIDGCHGKPCVILDFQKIAPLVVVGGIVLFHDFGKDSVGEPQPHCGVGDTWGACKQLGLLDGGCPGWEFVEHVVADKTQNGRDLGVFRRIC